VAGAKRSLAEATASSVMVATPARKKSVQPSQSHRRARRSSGGSSRRDAA
jgi:hypothetical protein